MISHSEAKKRGKTQTETMGQKAVAIQTKGKQARG